jgi:hypothetical protein
MEKDMDLGVEGMDSAIQIPKHSSLTDLGMEEGLNRVMHLVEHY